MTEPGSQTPFLVDPYLTWVRGEGVPVYEDFGFDLLSLELKPWARMEALGAYAHANGRGDFVNMYVCEMPPGGQTAPQRHLFEEVVYVLAGRGSTTVELDGEERSFEWGTGSLFALPLNASYRHFNGSGREPARVVSTTTLPLVLNVFRDQDFIWSNEYAFRGRFAHRPPTRARARSYHSVPGATCGRRTSCPTCAPSSSRRGRRAVPAAATSCSCSPTAGCTRTSRRCPSARTRRGIVTGPTSTCSR